MRDRKRLHSSRADDGPEQPGTGQASEDETDLGYRDRRWIGPEYRLILCLFRPTPRINFVRRIPLGWAGTVMPAGEVRHYGKAISVDHWEQMCDYYATYVPRYAKKWRGRKGKAVHDKSDFGRPLILWEERHNHELFRIR